MILVHSALASLMILALVVFVAWGRHRPHHGALAFMMLACIWLAMTVSMAVVFGLADHPVLGPYVGSVAGPVIAGALVAVALQAWAMRAPGSRWFRRLPELAAAGAIGALTGLLWQGVDWVV